MNSASSTPSPEQQPHTCGGNLASINAPSTGGHFLFEQPSKFGAQIQSGDCGFASFPAVPACVALIGAGRIAAKSRTPLCFPFPKINYVSHVDGSPSVGRTEVNTGAFP